MKAVEGVSRKGRNYLMILVRRESLRQKKGPQWVGPQEVTLNEWHCVTQPPLT